MKAILILGGLGLAIIGGLYLVPNVHDSVKEIVEVEKIVTPDWAQDEEAVKAAKDVIRKKELTAENDELQRQIDELKTKQAEVQKELGTYWTRENVKRLIRQTFPEAPDVAIAVATCESGLKPHAYNPKNTNGSTDGGLWQINSVHDKELARLGLNKYDPEDATKFARMLYEENHWNDWVCYTHGKLVMR